MARPGHKKPSFLSAASAVKLATSLNKKSAASKKDEKLIFHCWAADFNIKSSTIDILAEEYYDSFSTLRTITPEVIDALGLGNAQRDALTRAVRSLQNDENRASPTAHVVQDKMAVFRRIIDTFRDVNLIDERAHADITNESSFKVQLDAFKTVISRLEQEEVTDVKLESSDVDNPGVIGRGELSDVESARVTGCGEISDVEKRVGPRVQFANINAGNSSGNTVRNAQDNKTPDEINGNDTANVNTCNSNPQSTARPPNVLANITTVMSASRAFKNLTKKPRAAQKVYSARTGEDNLYFCYDDGSSNPYSIVARFGQRGKLPGQLGDASSACLTNTVSDCFMVVCDSENNRLQSFRANGSSGATIALFGFRDPHDVVPVDVSGGALAVSFARPGCVVVMSPDSVVHKNLQHCCPRGLATSNDRLYVTDTFTNDVYGYDISTSHYSYEPLWSLGVLNPGVSFNQPLYVAVSRLGKIIVSDTGNHCVKIFSDSGVFLHQFGSYGKANSQFKFPHGVCCDNFGHVIVADHYNNRVSLFGTEGEFIRHVATEKQGVKRPRGVDLSRDEKLYVTHGMLKATEIIVFDLSTPDSGF